MTGSGPASREAARQLVGNSTPFDSFKTAEQFIQFSIDPSKGLTKRRYNWFSDNVLFDSSSFTEIDQAGADLIRMEPNGGTARLRSAVAGQYVSQSLAKPGVGMDVADDDIAFNDDGTVYSTDGTIVAGAGWHDGTTGGWADDTPIETFLGIVINGEGAWAVLIANGSHIGGSPVPQSEWNVDVADGTRGDDNESNMQFDPSSGYIYNFPYTWYAFGALFVGVINPELDQQVLFHRFDDFDGGSLDRPNVPCIAMAEGNVNMTVGGLQYALYGADISGTQGEARGTDESRITSGNFIGDQVVTENEAINPTTETGKPIFAVRRDDDARDMSLRMDDFFATPTENVYIFAWDEYDIDNAVDGTWRDPYDSFNGSESKIQVNTTCTTYTPQEPVARGWDFMTQGEKGNVTESLGIQTNDQIPSDAGRVFTAVHDGATADISVRPVRTIEGY